MILDQLFRPRTAAISESELRGPIAWLQDLGDGSQRSSAGVTITQDSSMTLAAVFAAVRAIAEDVAKLPFKLYERLPERDGKPGGKRPMSESPLYRLAHIEPNEEMSSFDFRCALIANAVMWHGGFAHIVRDGSANPIAWDLIHPRKVTVKRDDGGRLFYRIQHSEQEFDDIEARDMIHVKGFGDNGLVGYMMSAVAKESWGVYRAAEQFSASFFGNGAIMSGVLSFDGPMKADAMKSYEQRLAEKHRGPGKANKTFVADHAAKFTPISTDAEKSQLIETLQFRIEDVARWFRMPPHKIQHLARATFSNIEHQSIEYVQDTIQPWLCRAEQEFTRKNLTVAQKQTMFFEHDLRALLRGDMQARSAFYNAGIRGGWLSRNEVRSAENMNPYEGGDAFLVEQNVSIVEEDGTIAPANQPSGEAQTPEQAQATAKAWLHDAISRAIAREVNAIAHKKNIDAEWLTKFYDGHTAEVESAVVGPIAALSGDASMARLYAVKHCSESVNAALVAVAANTVPEMLDDWRSERARRETDALIEDLNNG